MQLQLNKFNCIDTNPWIQQLINSFRISVNVKWGKEKFSEIECNTDEAPLIFKSALYSLTGVVPERMKVMVKGKAIGVSIFLLSSSLIIQEFRCCRISATFLL